MKGRRRGMGGARCGQRAVRVAQFLGVDTGRSPGRCRGFTRRGAGGLGLREGAGEQGCAGKERRGGQWDWQVGAAGATREGRRPWVLGQFGGSGPITSAPGTVAEQFVPAPVGRRALGGTEWPGSGHVPTACAHQPHGVPGPATEAGGKRDGRTP